MHSHRKDLIVNSSLQHSATLYIPSQRSDGKPIENRDHLIESVASELTDLTGGTTLTSGKGYWKNGSGGLAIEDVTLATSFCDDLQSIETDLIALAIMIKSVGCQESVALELDRLLYFI